MAMDDRSVEGHAHLVTKCAWCDRVLLADGSWASPSPDLLARATAAGSVTHAICPTCFGREQPDALYPL
jgi:hypothetical protein